MSTKIKGEAIKEGSIPLSALSSEAQEKIENSGSKVFVFTHDMVKSENEDGSLTIDPANAIEMINSDFINMMDGYNMEKTYTYGDFAVFSFTLKLDPLMSQVIVMYVHSEGVIEIMSAGEEHPFVYDSDSGENENKVYKRLSLLDLALGDSDSKDYTKYIDEVKENVKKNLGITDAVTPDWNAQQGEAGYIENRTHANIRETKTLTTGDYTLEDGKLTFGHIFNGGDAIRIDRDLIDSGSNNLNNNIKIHGVDHYRSDINEHFFYCVKDIINPSKDKKYPIYFDIDYDNIVGYIKIYEYESEYYLSIITNADQNDTFRVNYEIFKPLDTNYLPNTIIKTTPQQLSDTDKNQALVNLGIDPVILKYICNPLIIKEGEKIPIELCDYNVNEEGLTLNWRIKHNYRNLNMYLLIDPYSEDTFPSPLKNIDFSDDSYITFTENGSFYVSCDCDSYEPFWGFEEV